MLNVHLRINDATTGEALPVRLRIAGPQQEDYPPLGRIAEFSTMRGEDVGGQLLLGQERWFSVAGGVEVPLPAGVPLRIQATHGPSYQPLDQLITLKPGQMAIRLAMPRLLHWQHDWQSGDARCHFIPPHAALLEAAVEDLDVVNLLVQARRYLGQDGNTYQSFTNIAAFSGQRPALQEGGRLVAVNSFNTHPMLGQLGLLHAHRLIFPLTFGPPDDTDDWSLTDWCHQCHRKKGFVVWANPWRKEGGLAGGEGLLLALLGQIDALEFDGQPRAIPFLPLWYRLLNCGIRIPLVGSSAKDSNRLPLGYPRTYVRQQPEQVASYSSWVEGLRERESFVSNGPFLKLSVDESASLARAVSESVFPFERLEMVCQGKSCASSSAELRDGLWRATCEYELQWPHSQWLAARILGRSFSPLAPTQPLFAHTNPIWLDRPELPMPVQQADREFWKPAIEQTRDWLAEQGQFTQDSRKLQHLERCAEVLQLLERLPERSS